MSATSAYAVCAKTTGDVAAAVDFAREHNLRLVVKGGGHSYLGTSNAPDSLLIWTRAMDDIVLHDDFVPRGCTTPPLPAVSVGAGAIWPHVYDAVTTKAGRYVQGGGCTTVGVAGLIQSGGFGSFSKHYGTAASSLLEAEVVTADGTVRIANACTNPDLFWALKGGGGGTFGVATRLTLKTHELADRAGAAIFTVKAMSGEAFRALIRKFIAFYGERLLNPHWGESIYFRRNETLSVMMVSRGLDKAATQAVWQPFFDWVAVSPRDYRLQGTPVIAEMPARDWWNAKFRKKYTPAAIISDPRSGASPDDFCGPEITTKSAHSGTATSRGGFLHRCFGRTSSNGSPTHCTRRADTGRSRFNSMKGLPAHRMRHSPPRATLPPTRPCSARSVWQSSAVLDRQLIRDCPATCPISLMLGRRRRWSRTR
jgi:FAD binding domain